MAVGFRPAVHGEMLGGGVELAVLRVVALQAAHEAHAHARGQERILAVGFLSAPPARIAEDIDVGRPEGQALVAAVFATPQGLVVLGARFVADRSRHLVHQRHVEGRGQADGLREHRRAARARHAVQRLVPPVVGGQPRRSIAGAAFCICAAFSSSVMRDTRSAARSSKLQRGVQVRRRGRALWSACRPAHAPRARHASSHGPVVRSACVPVDFMCSSVSSFA